jgi:hypothetical protein
MNHSEYRNKQYQFEVLDDRDYSPEEVEQHFVAYRDRRCRELFQQWEAANPEHGLTADQQEEKKAEVFWLSHGSGTIRIVPFP